MNRTELAEFFLEFGEFRLYCFRVKVVSDLDMCLHCSPQRFGVYVYTDRDLCTFAARDLRSGAYIDVAMSRVQLAIGLLYLSVYHEVPLCDRRTTL